MTRRVARMITVAVAAAAVVFGTTRGFRAQGSTVTTRVAMSAAITREDFMRRVYDEQVRRALAHGRKRYPNLSADELGVVEGDIR